MEVKTIGGSGRKIKPSFISPKQPVIFMKWNNEYRFTIEIYNSADGSKLQFSAGQLEWEDIITKLQNLMHEATA